MTTNEKSKKSLIYNLVFLSVCAGIFLFLWNAPPESTTRLPHDENHQKFHPMGKKEAEKFCRDCHGPEEDKIHFPEGHPPKYRCLFCHKQDKK